MIRHIDNEALCFALVTWNLVNSKSKKQDEDDNGSRYMRGLVVSVSYFYGFYQNLKSEMWSNSVPRFFVFIHLNRGLPDG